jgi:hypothetical protein
MASMSNDLDYARQLQEDANCLSLSHFLGLWHLAQGSVYISLPKVRLRHPRHIAKIINRR